MGHGSHPHRSFGKATPIAITRELDSKRRISLVALRSRDISISPEVRGGETIHGIPESVASERTSSRSGIPRLEFPSGMFRIKTDIRTYECQSEERVERLIRNWVVRPTDLIFHDDREEWEPIGEHPAFSETFAEMAERAEDVPETEIVDEDDQDEDDEEEPGGYTPDLSGLGEASSEPSEPSADEETSQSGGSVTVEGADEDAPAPDESTNVTPSPYADDEPEASELSETAQMESATSGTSSSSATHRTGTETHEVTAQMHSMTSGASSTAPERASAPNVGSASPSADETRRANERDGRDDESPSPSNASAGAEVPVEGNTDERIESREDVPDELLATNEMASPAPERHGDFEVDETPPPEASEDDTMTDASSTAPSVDAPSPPEADAPAAHESESTASASPVEGLEAVETETDTEPESDDDDDLEAELQEQSREADVPNRQDDEWDEIMETLRETDELDPDDVEQISETRDDLAIGRDEDDDDEEDVPDEIREYVSEGYDLELPVEVGPSFRDRQLGLQRSQASEARKDRTFPAPSTKREGEIVERSFGFETPRDLSLLIVAIFVVTLVLLIATAVVLLGT